MKVFFEVCQRISDCVPNYIVRLYKDYVSRNKYYKEIILEDFSLDKLLTMTICRKANAC